MDTRRSQNGLGIELFRPELTLGRNTRIWCESTLKVPKSKLQIQPICYQRSVGMTSVIQLSMGLGGLEIEESVYLCFIRTSIN